MATLHLIWQTNRGDQTSFEQEYISNLLFGSVHHTKIFDHGSCTTVVDHAVIIYSNNARGVSAQFRDYLTRFNAQNFTFFLLHLSNESLSHDSEYYKLAKHVMRSYYGNVHATNVCDNNCLVVPLGFKTGFYNKHMTYRTLPPKKYTFCFIGQPKSDRVDVIDALQRVGNSFIHTTNRWNCPSSLSATECAAVYRETRFVPCPMGWTHPDSFRIMEVLESGSIPVLKAYPNLEYFTKVWGESPLPTVDSWGQLDALALLDSERYCELYSNVMRWYDLFKTDLADKIRTIVA